MGERYYQDLKIFDFHLHFRIASDSSLRKREPVYEPGTPAYDAWEYRKQQVARYQEQWRMAWDFPKAEPENRTWQEEADLWVQEMERYGIAKLGFVTGGGNDQLADVVRRHPDEFVGFAHHDPFEEGAAEELERAVTELGLKGYKMLAPTLSRRIDDKSAYGCWEVAAKHGIPVLIHFGMQGAAGGISFNDKINPGYLEPVARDFPTVNFVVPHFGIQYVKELLFLCWSCPNVLVDTCGSNQWVRWMPYDLTLEDLFRKFYETVGPERIIFGTDSSWFPRGFAIRYLQDQLRICRFMNMKHEDLQLIFGGNAARLFHMEW